MDTYEGKRRCSEVMTTIGFVPEVIECNKYLFDTHRLAKPQNTLLFHHLWPKTESTPDQIDVMWVQGMPGGIYKGKRRCSEVMATIGFTLYHMGYKLSFLGSWSAQNDSKWKHSYHMYVHYMTSSDTRVTCVLWGISCALISNMLTGLRLISTCDTVCIMWLQI
jgi:hypothetical protein